MGAIINKFIMLKVWLTFDQFDREQIQMERAMVSLQRYENNARYDYL